MIAAAILLPVLGGAVLWPLGVRIAPRRRRGALGAAAVGLLAASLTAAAVAAVTDGRLDVVWSAQLSLTFTADGVAGIVAVLVPAVAIVVTAYASVHEDVGGLPRLLGLMVAFTGAMQLVVLAADLLALTIGWELVAVCSWALIGSAWNSRDAVGKAAHAFNATRVGSIGLIVAAGAAFATTGSFAYDAIGDVPRPMLDVVAGGVLLAAMSKSAQLPFSPWLFSAMAGPTSVSALLHSATMVAAGAYALIVLGPSLATVGWFGPVVTAVGLATALIGGVVALGEVHGKRILAASTAAQYGLMFTAVGVGAPGAAVAHLAAHALLKSQLFLAIGVGMSATGTGDVRRWRLGGRMPTVAVAAAVGALALAAAPPLGAAWTKEQIVAATVTNIVNLMNVLYTDQINVYVQLADLVFYSTDSGGRSWDDGSYQTDWNQEPSGGDRWYDGNSKFLQGCPTSQYQGDTGLYLDAFRSWVYNHMASETTDLMTPTQIFCRRRIGSVFCAAIAFSVPVITKYAASAPATRKAITAGRSIIERQRSTKSTFCVHSSARISGLSWNRNAHLSMARIRGESSQCR